MANSQPRIVGFLCENGAHIFYDVSNPARRKLPRHFIGLAIASVSQVRMSEILKAFLSGADGVLIAGCEVCQCHQDWRQIQMQFSAIGQALADYGIERNRLRLEWISATDEEKFLQIVHEMTENLRHLPALRLPAGLNKNVAYCG